MACITNHNISTSIWLSQGIEIYICWSACYIVLNAAKDFIGISGCFVRLCYHFEFAVSTPGFRYCFWKAHAGCSTSDTDEMLPTGPILGPRCAKSESLRVRLKNKQVYSLGLFNIPCLRVALGELEGLLLLINV